VRSCAPPLRFHARTAQTIARANITGNPADPDVAYGMRRTAMLLETLLESPHRVVVEVGSGSGIATRCLPFLPGNEVAVGVDVDAGALRKVGKPQDRVDYVLASADASLPFRGESVDALVASEVYEHLQAPGAFLDEVHRVLKPGGRLVLTTPNTESIVLVFLRILPRTWARRILARTGARQVFLHPEFFDRYDGNPHSHRIEGASLREMGRLARPHGFRQMRGTTWGLPFAPTFGGVLPSRPRLFLLTRLHELGVGLRHILIVWDRDA
jgi:SAM-dependent methyltransferase